MSSTDLVAIPEDWPQTIVDLLARIEQGRGELEAFLAPLSEQQLSATPNPDGWMLKDHLAHLAVWQAGIAALLRREDRAAAMGLGPGAFAQMEATGDYDTPNAEIFRQHRHKTSAEARDFFAATYADLLATLGRMSDADLARTYSAYAPEGPGEETGAPIVGWVMGNTYEHYAEHIVWMAEQIAP
jgi:DinB superfamily